MFQPLPNFLLTSAVTDPLHAHLTLFGHAQGQRLRGKKRGLLPSPVADVRAWLSKTAPRGWEDGNSVTLKEADSTRPSSFPLRVALGKFTEGEQIL